MAGYSAGYSESKISNPEKSFDHPRHLKSGVPPPPPPPGLTGANLTLFVKEYSY